MEKHIRDSISAAYTYFNCFNWYTNKNDRLQLEIL